MKEIKYVKCEDAINAFYAKIDKIGVNDPRADGLYIAGGIIENLPAADVGVKSKWILTRDALPTEDGVYFLYYKSLGELVVGHGYFSSDLKKFGEPISVYNCEKSDWEDSFDEYQCEVIAWMAIPELPDADACEG